MNKAISSLVSFYLNKKYISLEDVPYCTNQVAQLINNIDCEFVEVEPNLYDSLEIIINCAVEKQIISDITFEKEILESKITNIFVSRPSIINEKFKKMDNKQAREWFLNLGIDTNYIKYHDLQNNISYVSNKSKGDLQVTINLSKPEKDPREIAMLKDVKTSSCPACCLCEENVGFVGSINQAARSNHRVIPIMLNNRDFLFQFSPYMYYDEHCIVIQKEHCDMVTDDNTVLDQLDFVEKFPGYFIGTNADIPIVGGSILNHNHYQGGNKKFPLDLANTKAILLDDEVKVSYLDWYLTTLKIESKNKEAVSNYVNKLREAWNSFENKSINIFNSGENRHNAINTITRYEDGIYSVLVILRNNKTSDEFPFGMFHPPVNLHHIKKENIGLIEAMGLAILPGRLKEEIEEIKKEILGKESNVSEHHMSWANELLTSYENSDIDIFMQDKLASKFEDVLKCCNVLKYANNDIEILENLLRRV